MTDAQKRAAKASQIRKKKKDGKYVAPNESEWLAQYEILVKPRSKELPLLPSAPIPDEPSKSKLRVDYVDTSVHVTKPDNSGDFKMPGFDAPDPEGDEQIPPGLDDSPNDTGNGTKSKPLDAEFVNEKKEKEQASDAAKAQGKAAADYYCALLNRMSAECEAMGGIGIPKEFVNTIFHYAATGTFTRLAQSVGGEMSETMQDITTLGGVGALYVQRHLLRQKQEENGPIPGPSKPIEGNAPPKAPSEDRKGEPKVKKSFAIQGMLGGKAF